MSEYFPNNCWVFDTGNNLDIATAFTTSLYVDIKVMNWVRENDGGHALYKVQGKAVSGMNAFKLGMRSAANREVVTYPVHGVQ